MGMKHGTAKAAMATLCYLITPSATKDAIARLEYWRSQPRLSEAIAKGNELAMREDEYDKLNG
jgi:hypothetical protein